MQSNRYKDSYDLSFTNLIFLLRTREFKCCQFATFHKRFDAFCGPSAETIRKPKPIDTNNISRFRDIKNLHPIQKHMMQWHKSHSCKTTKNFFVAPHSLGWSYKKPEIYREILKFIIHLRRKYTFQDHIFNPYDIL